MSVNTEPSWYWSSLTNNTNPLQGKWDSYPTHYYQPPKHPTHIYIPGQIVPMEPYLPQEVQISPPDGLSPSQHMYEILLIEAQAAEKERQRILALVEEAMDGSSSGEVKGVLDWLKEMIEGKK